ncbi:MAG TPA: type III pantothenate kinase [Castellaniella sp.]|nr:type III pantothenate kinase [Castellaniella sp.]
MSPQASLILLVDAGNTRGKFGWLDLRNGAREQQAHILEYDQIEGLGSRLETLGIRPQGIAGTNVAGPVVGQRLEAICQQQLGLSIRWLDGRHGQGQLQNRYLNNRQLGADRWIALIGLLHRVRQRADWLRGAAMVLATFGTATTIDTLVPGDGDEATPQAQFPGGLILPGPVLMARSLADHTAHLPFAEGAPAAYPVDTHNAISSGIAAAQAGALLRQWRHGFRDMARLAPQVFVSGGGWPLVQAEVEQDLACAQADLGLPHQAVVHIPSPVLDGLACLMRDDPPSSA